MMASEITRVEPDDPNRCQAIIPNKGQCLNRAVPGGTNCLVHGGNKQEESMRLASVRNYRLGKFQAELERHASSPALKSLRDEIAILRLTLEQRFQRCEDITDLILQSGPISDLVMKIERVVSSCHKLEGAMSQLLDKQAILQFANELIGLINITITEKAVEGSIITPEFRDSLINNLANGILTLVSKIGTTEEGV